MADITYVLNDPTTEFMMIGVDLPPKLPVMDFKVDGFRGATEALYTLEHQAACCYYSIIQAVKLINKNLHYPLTRWAVANTLFVQPRAGKQLNAFYDRHALRFFYSTDPVTKKIVYAVNSFDVFNHELGHAILDAIRPDLFNLQAMEVWAFHEAFGDIHAIINMLQYDLVLDYMLQETGGDLRKSNIATRLAEEMGTAIFNMTRGRMGHTSGFLRNAVNDFTYVEPEKLPKAGRDDQLLSEPHNFSRVWTGTWYDLLVAIYEQEKNTLPPKEALIKARDVLTFYTFRSLRLAPATIRFFDAVAKAMLVIDKGKGYPYNQAMNQVFLKRQILRQSVRPMVAMNWIDFQTDSVESTDEVFTESEVVVVRNKKTELLPLPNHMMTVEAPADTYYEFNGTGDCVDVVTNSVDELVDHAQLCVDFLKEHGLIRPDKAVPFALDDEGNLIRSHFACGCGGGSNLPPCGCINNCTTPGAPEYGKCWKPENNAGCGCNRKKEPECTTVSETKVSRSKRLRVNGCGCSTIECGTGGCSTTRVGTQASARVKC